MRRALTFAFAGLLAACGTVPELPGVTPHRIEIQQGNYISQEMVAKLKPGMTREQVRYALGTPLVTDIFHADRWDYVYTRDLPGKPKEKRILSVFFENGKLARAVGDLMPSQPEEAPRAPAKPAATAAPVPPKPAEPAVTKPVAEVAPQAPAAPATEAAKPAAEPAKAAADPVKAAAEPAKPAAEEPAERGFFGRLIDKLKGKE